MATIGLDSLYYSTITENADGEETYGNPERFAKAISADISVELNEASLYADDGESETVKEFKKGTISLNIDEVSAETAAALFGATVDNNGVIVSSPEDDIPYVAIGFRARRSDGSYAYYWLYRVKFSVPGGSLATKGDGISFSTPTIEGTIMRRHKEDGNGNHPWKVEAKEDANTQPTVITNWFKNVYEPTFA